MTKKDKTSKNIKVEEKKEQKASLILEIVDKLNTLMVTGFGLVAALAWNDAIKSLFNIYFPKPAENVWALFIYASVITIIIVIITVYLARYLKKLKDTLAEIEKKLNKRRSGSPKEAPKN